MRVFLVIILVGLAFSLALIGLGALVRNDPGPLAGVALGLAIFGTGMWFLRGIARSRPREQVTAEDVAELDVFFVCGECGTEFRVEKIGELQVPRHCGEPMLVERRPRGISPG